MSMMPDPPPGIWQAWSPTITSSAGTITTVTLNAGKFCRVGRLIKGILDFTITTNGTGSGYLIITYPPSITPAILTAVGCSATTGRAVCGIPTGGSIALFKYDGTYPGGTGERIYLDVTIQI